MGRDVRHTEGMKKTTVIDTSAIMADYTAQMIAEAQRRQAIREGRIAAPQAQWSEWNISDRH